MKNQHGSLSLLGSCRGLFASGATLLSLLTIFLSATLASSVSKVRDSRDQDTTTPNADSVNATEQSSSCYEEVKMVVVRSSGSAESFNTSADGSTPWINIMQAIMEGTIYFNSYQDLVHFCANLTLKESANASFCHSALPNFTSSNAVSVITYSCLLVVASCGNLTVFITLFRNRGHKSRINMFIMHLAIADLIVTFITLPLEIAWHSTVSWWAGDLACRVLMFFRALGFYLSSCIVVSISLDRYLAIVRPFSIAAADTRAKMMLFLSWALSIIASVPQECNQVSPVRRVLGVMSYEILAHELEIPVDYLRYRLLIPDSPET
ncbi:gonadotropin-releasing hormone receptor [Elysia marginata]|uniref:Gonadotropin-releasing hormone receptor n=1 Tax=Elysia marginata TaxID=1093978 RepID=A0AAV4GWR4_9GAST|nr:gonadotropin-releasing hormone receptor [Elysia marginata]